jgi:NhaP-type Na+/H+ or K+/H+ antiporter
MDEQQKAADEPVKRLFEAPVFVLLGLALPIDGWLQLGWPAVAVTALILLLRRPPMLWIIAPGLWRVERPNGALFAGWFGPIGIAALYYAMLSQRHLEGHEDIWSIASMVIAASTVIHGMTATPFTRLLAARLDRTRPAEAAEPAGARS